MPLRDLITDFGAGRLSHTKMGAILGYLTLTTVFLWQAWRGNMTAELFMGYGLLMLGAAAGSKFLSLRHFKNTETKTRRPRIDPH